MSTFDYNALGKPSRNARIQKVKQAELSNTYVAASMDSNLWKFYFRKCYAILFFVCVNSDPDMKVTLLVAPR
jgi:hypothetical protein